MKLRSRACYIRFLVKGVYSYKLVTPLGSMDNAAVCRTFTVGSCFGVFCVSYAFFFAFLCIFYAVLLRFVFFSCVYVCTYVFLCVLFYVNDFLKALCACRAFCFILCFCVFSIASGRRVVGSARICLVTGAHAG